MHKAGHDADLMLETLHHLIHVKRIACQQLGGKDLFGALVYDLVDDRRFPPAKRIDYLQLVDAVADMRDAVSADGLDGFHAFPESRRVVEIFFHEQIDPRDKFYGAERFCQEVVRIRFHYPLVQVVYVESGNEHHERIMKMVFNPAAKLETAYVGQHDIQNDDLKFGELDCVIFFSLAGRKLQQAFGILGARSDLYIHIAVHFKRLAHDHNDILVIIDYIYRYS